jgi:hypothetical protein
MVDAPVEGCGKVGEKNEGVCFAKFPGISGVAFSSGVKLLQTKGLTAKVVKMLKLRPETRKPRRWAGAFA